MRRARKFIMTVLAVLFAAIGTGASDAYAQQYPALGGPSPPAPVLSQPPAPPPPGMLTSGLQVIVTPYLWLANVNAAISTPLARAPVVDTSVGAVQPVGRRDPSPGRDQHHHSQCVLQRRQRIADDEYRHRGITLSRGRSAGS